MSGLEIERKFLVKKGGAYRNASYAKSHIQQVYIPSELMWKHEESDVFDHPHLREVNHIEQILNLL